MTPPEPVGPQGPGRRPTSERVRVVGPRTDARPPGPRSGAAEIEDQTRLGELYLASLMRTQLRSAAGVLGLLLLVVVGLPALVIAVPGLAATPVLGVTLGWALLGFGVYPALVLLGWLYVRRAERTERDFTDAVERE